MKELENKIFDTLGRTTKKKFYESLGMSFPTFKSRMEKGGWTKLEIDFINNIVVDEKGDIKDKRG